MSVAVNGALVVLLGVALWRSTPIRETRIPARPLPHYERIDHLDTIHRVRQPETAVENTKFHWSQIESTDYRQYIANLRAIRCPEETIRDIVIGDVNKLYSPKLAALYATSDEFWQSPGGSHAARQRNRLEQFKQLEREKGEVLRELLGIDPSTETSRTAGLPDPTASSVAFLSESKRQPVRALIRGFETREQDIYRRADGIIGSDDRDRLVELSREKRRALGELLTPGELEEYELRDSFTADQMRAKLVGFEPTADEFRALFRLERAFDEQFNPHPQYQNDDPEFQRRMMEASQQLEIEIERVLGGQRYGDYRRSQDPAYRSLIEVGQRYELPSETLNRVYEMKQAAEEQMKQAVQSALHDPSQAQVIARSLSQQTAAAVRAMLGEKAFESYVQRGGRWVVTLGR